MSSEKSYHVEKFKATQRSGGRQHCSRERNDIHDTVIHELALMAERAGYPMDHECRYVCRPAGSNGEPGYKPDAVWWRIPIPQIVASEAGDNSAFNRDIQLTD